MSIIEKALMLAASGWPVFACNRRKAPITKRGYLDASTDPATVRAMFSKGAELIGVPTGPASGFDVLDIDPDKGGLSWEGQHAQSLGNTRIHTTRSGGRHYLFQADGRLRNSASRIAPGVDVRAGGGYVIVPPSPGYRVINEANLAAWPDWLLRPGLAMPPATETLKPINPADTHAITNERLRRYIEAVLRNVSQAPDGQKHVRLRNAALAIGGVAAAAEITDAEAWKMLRASLPHSVRDWAAAQVTASWGLARGRARPIVLHDRPHQGGGRG